MCIVLCDHIRYTATDVEISHLTVMDSGQSNQCIAQACTPTTSSLYVFSLHVLYTPLYRHVCSHFARVTVQIFSLFYILNQDTDGVY